MQEMNGEKALSCFQGWIMDLLLGRSRLSVTHCQEGNKAAEGNTEMIFQYLYPREVTLCGDQIS